MAQAVSNSQGGSASGNRFRIVTRTATPGKKALNKQGILALSALKENTPGDSQDELPRDLQATAAALYKALTAATAASAGAGAGWENVDPAEAQTVTVVAFRGRLKRPTTLPVDVGAFKRRKRRLFSPKESGMIAQALGTCLVSIVPVPALGPRVIMVFPTNEPPTTVVAMVAAADEEVVAVALELKSNGQPTLIGHAVDAFLFKA